MEKETPLPAEEVKVSTPRESDEKNNSTTTTPQSQAKSDKEQQGQSAEASLLKDEVDEVSDKQPTKAVGRGTKEIDNIDDHDASIEIQMQNDKPPPHPMSHPQNPNENNGENRPLPFSNRDQNDTENQSRSSVTEFTEASASPGDPHHALSPQHQPFPHAAPSWPMHPVTESLQYYEAQMRDHAAAYASAAAGAAWAAAQIAAGVDSPGPLNPPMIFPNVPLPGNPPPPVIAPHDSPQHQAIHSTSQAGQPGPVPQFQVPAFPPPVLPVPPPMALPGAPQTYNFYSAPYQNQSGHNVHQYNPFRGTPTGEEDGSYYHRHRRKRQQRRRPSDSSPFEFSPSSRHSQQRSFLQSSCAHSQGSDDVTTAASVDSTERHSGRRRKSNQVARRNSHLPSGASSSSDGHYRHNKKKPRQPTDGSLLGKSPVSALYEWCGKRKTNPVFELQEQNPETANHEFEVTVSIDSEILGKGRGGSKSAAKQDAARKALQELLPGVLFDTQSGVLIQLSQEDGKQPAAMQKREVTLPTSLDDLAPHLEKRLAIGQNSDSKSDKAAKKRKPTDATRPLHRLYSTYPGTSTTSEEEDENVYYASRGASICSTLLHAMVQIDDRIDEPPQYTFEVQNAPALATNGQKRKTSPSIASHRGSFICVGTLMLKEKELQGGEGDKTEDERIETLTASGVAATKREARHIASAKLLALLFPDCDGMVQVKEAAEAAREKYAASKAEAAREKYAASKALKQHWKRREEAPRKETSPLSQTSSDESSSRFLDAMLVSNETGSPELPSQISSHFLKALRYSQDIGQTTSRVTHESDEGQSANLTRADLYHARQLSRQRQLDDELTRALQQLNEHDEEGRVLPDELTVDDVGRTVLRKATPDDMEWIRGLVGADTNFSSSPISILSKPDKTRLESDSNGQSYIQLWSSSTIAVLLCRAIAPYDEPPLGCAVLTLGFSMESGRSLRVAQIASEPHLPRERLIECLEELAGYMGCTLETSMPSTSVSSHELFDLDQLQNIIRTHLGRIQRRTDQRSQSSSAMKKIGHRHNLFTTSTTGLAVSTTTPLQSVREESDGGEESEPETGKEKRNAKKSDNKPSKRSRVE